MILWCEKKNWARVNQTLANLANALIFAIPASCEETLLFLWETICSVVTAIGSKGIMIVVDKLNWASSFSTKRQRTAGDFLKNPLGFCIWPFAIKELARTILPIYSKEASVPDLWRRWFQGPFLFYKNIITNHITGWVFHCFTYRPSKAIICLCTL